MFPAIRKGGALIPGNGMTPRAVGYMVKARVRAALGEEWAQRISPHSLRHTFITLALAEGASLHKV
jgi:site-specific recombinase XerD